MYFAFFALAALAIYIFFAVRKVYGEASASSGAMTDASLRCVEMKTAGASWEETDIPNVEFADVGSISGGQFLGTIERSVESVRATVLDWQANITFKGGIALPCFQTVVILDDTELDSPKFYLRPGSKSLMDDDNNDGAFAKHTTFLEMINRAPGPLAELIFRQIDAKLSAEQVVETKTELDKDFILESRSPVETRGLFRSEHGRNVLTPAFTKGGWTVEWNGSRFIAYRLNRLVPADKMDDHLASVLQLVEMLRGSSAIAAEYLDNRIAMVAGS